MSRKPSDLPPEIDLPDDMDLAEAGDEGGQGHAHLDGVLDGLQDLGLRVAARSSQNIALR
jgi:hypothetical protein